MWDIPVYLTELLFLAINTEMAKVLLNEQEVSHPHYLPLALTQNMSSLHWEKKGERAMDLDEQSLPLSAFAEAPLAQLIWLKWGQLKREAIDFIHLLSLSLSSWFFGKLILY